VRTEPAPTPEPVLAPCPQAWAAGLESGLLVECRFAEHHRGWHRNAARDLAWGGKLTPAEHRRAAELRERCQPPRHAIPHKGCILR